MLGCDILLEETEILKDTLQWIP